MSAADAREQLEDAIRRAMGTCAFGDCPECKGSLNVAMTAATVYAEQYAAHAIEQALAPYRLRDATAEHSPRGGRAT